MDFQGFPKIARLSRDMVVTEKIDGTNAQVFIERIMGYPDCEDATIISSHEVAYGDAARDPEFLVLRAGSRSRWLTREADNFGFAKWVQENATGLWALGEGSHFGEWWGSGVQRGYGLTKGEKRFSLFNTGRWFDQHTLNPVQPCTDKMEQLPACCHVVPVLHRGPFNTDAVNHVLWNLQHTGSIAAPGFMNPEGIIIWHEAARQLFKKTIEGDEKPKGAQ